MMKTGSIDLARTRWQYLFPEGLKEQYPHSDGSVSETHYTRQWCQGMVDRYRRFRDAMVAFGMPEQPLPVQIQHVGVTGDYFSSEDRRRVGSIYDLAYVPAGKSIPAGIWALIEWTEEGLKLISSGAFNCLSPTNTTYGVLSTGEKIPGDFLIEVSLVDVPFLEAIGMASDYLPFNAIPYTGSRDVVNATTDPDQQAARSWSHQPSGLVISRGARYRSLPMPEGTETVEFSLTPDKLTPEILTAIMDSPIAQQKMREMMEPALDEMLMKRGIKREAPATEPANTSAATPTIDETIEQSARAAEDAMLAEEVDAAVRGRKLLAKDTAAYIKARRAGENGAAFLKDFSAVADMAGHSNNPNPDKSGNVKKRSAKQIMSELEKELHDAGKYNYVEHVKLGKTRIAEARAKGLLEE